MAVLNQSQDGQNRNLFQSMIDPKRLQAVRPSTGQGVTVFRPIPEVAPDGSIRPMVLDDTPLGYDFSNTHLEGVVINSGIDAKFSGFVRPSDRPDASDFDCPFSGLYIRLKSKLKKKEIPRDHPLRDRVEDLFEGGMKQPLKHTGTMLLMQGVVMELNGKQLEKPASRQCLFLTKTAASAINDTLTAAHKDGLDVFDPENGRMIILEPERQRDDKYYFNAVLGDRMPLKPELCQRLWQPWESTLIYQPWQRHMEALVRAFGRDIVELAFSRREVARALGEEAVEERRRAPAADVSATLERELDDQEADKPADKPATEREAVSYMQIDTELPETPIDGASDAVDDDDEIPAPKTSRDKPKDDSPVAPEDPEELADYYQQMLGEDL